MASMGFGLLGFNRRTGGLLFLSSTKFLVGTGKARTLGVTGSCAALGIQAE